MATLRETLRRLVTLPAVPLLWLPVLGLALLGLPLAACGGRPAPTAEVDDGGAQHDGTADARKDAPPADAPLPALCSGAGAHMIANGIDSHPSVTGSVLPLDCCDAAEFVVVTQTVPADLVPIVVMWRAQVGQAQLPATIDLANPPVGWSVQVYVGCEPTMGNCNPLPDGYTAGLTGTLEVAPTSDGSGYTMSLCLAVAEAPGSPHPLLHSLELWAPAVTASY